MSEEQQSAAGIDFNKLKPMNGGGAKLKTFTVVGKELTEKQKKAGYYRQINAGDNIDGIFNGISKDERGDFPSYDVSLIGLDGAETIVRANTSLRMKMQDVQIGSPLRLTFTGTSKLTKGLGKGKVVLNWSVSI